jgi:hypothetical protein
VKPQFKHHISHWRLFSPMARPYFLFRSLAVGLVLAAAFCPLQIAPGAEQAERQYTRDQIRTYRPRTPTEFFNQDAVRFERVRIDTSGLIYADGHSLSLYGVALIPATKSATHPMECDGPAGSAPSWPCAIYWRENPSPVRSSISRARQKLPARWGTTTSRKSCSLRVGRSLRRG